VIEGLEPVREGLAAEVLHGDPERAVFDPGVDDLDDVGVAQRRHEPRLALKPLHQREVHGERGVQELERHGAVEGYLHRLVDAPHAALPEGTHHAKSPGEDGPLVEGAAPGERVEGVVH
jgi:hypothetical protein